MSKEELKYKAKDFIDRINKESDGMWLNKYFLLDLLVMFATENGIQWHDLRKDPNDLPKDERYVWTNVGPGHYDSDGIWWDDFGRLQDVIAWCEPQFEENIK